jgi:hypothetical protein
MPYTSIEEAKAAKFPTTADKVPLTLAQINHLARIYDAIKKASSADNPMAVSWTQWKDIYEKKDDKWVLKEGQKGVSEAFVDGVSEPEWIPVAKVGQNIKYRDSGGAKILTEAALKNAQGTWKGGNITKNHGDAWDTFKILDEKLELPFLYLKMDGDVEAAIKSNETTGVSVEVNNMGLPNEKLENMIGTGLSILWDRPPACNAEMGCASADVNQEDYHEGGGKEKMGKEGEEPVTFTEEQAKAMVASAVAEVTEKLDNAHAVETTDLEKANTTKIEELETEHAKIVKEAEDTTTKLKEQIESELRGEIKTKLGMSDEVAKTLDVFNAEQLNAMKGWAMPTVATAAAGISSAAGESSETPKEEILGTWDPVKGEFAKGYRRGE